MIKKDIVIDGNTVPFRASATIPRLYRAKFQRDIFTDLNRLQKTVDPKNKTDSGLGMIDLEIFENVAYVMAKHADNTQPDSPEEWLDQFDTFSIYHVLPQLLELWHLNIVTDIEAKKKRDQQAGK